MDTPSREDKVTSTRVINMHSVSSKAEHTPASTSQKKHVQLVIKRLV